MEVGLISGLVTGLSFGGVGGGGVLNKIKLKN